MNELDCLKKKYEISKFAYEKALEEKENKEANEIIKIELPRIKLRELIIGYKRFMEIECIKPSNWVYELEKIIK